MPKSPARTRSEDTGLGGWTFRPFIVVSFLEVVGLVLKRYEAGAGGFESRPRGSLPHL
jgi:hypothetical protein